MRRLCLLVCLLMILGNVHYSDAWEVSMPGEARCSFRFLSSSGLNSGLPGSGVTWHATGRPSSEQVLGPDSIPSSSRSVLDYQLELSARPTLTVYEAFRLVSGFTIRKRFDPIRPYTSLEIPNPQFSGSPPFDLHYRQDFSASFSDPPDMQISCDRFWLGFTPPGRTGLWIGTKGVPMGTGATLGKDFTNELLMLRVGYDPLTLTLATGASLPRNASTSAMQVPVPASTGLFQALTAAYTVTTGVYIASWVAWIYYIGDLFSWESDSDSEECNRAGENGSNGSLVKMSPSHGRETRSSDEEESTDDGLSFCLLNLADDYVDILGDRTPIHLVHVSHSGEFWNVGLGMVSYPHLSRFPIEGPALPSNGQDRALVSFVHGELKFPNLATRAEYATVGWDLYKDDGKHEFRVGYHVFSEAEVSFRGTRASFMFGYASGNAQTERGTHVAFPINYDVLKPYEFLMFHTYSGGTPSWEGPPGFRHGVMSDVYALGARLEFAAAANLNLWGSYFWARRLETCQHSTPSHSHLGSSLGHEFNLGADWRLADNLSVRLRAAWWNPGPWFSARTSTPSTPGIRSQDAAEASVLGITGSMVWAF